MTKIKLKEWADRHNLSYLTANRHFHAGMIPGAVQLDSGTILVEDETLEQNMAGTAANSDAMSLFLKKTVEFSKNNSTVEDFAAYVISNFQLKLHGTVESPRYSKNRPKAEEVQKHFQQFLPDKEAVEHLKAVKNLLKEGKTAGDVVPSNLSPQAAELSEVLGNVKPFERVQDPTNEVGDFDQLFELSDSDEEIPPVVMNMVATNTGGLVNRSVDFDTTPQQINYTGSTSQTFSTSLNTAVNGTATAGGSLTFGDTIQSLYMSAAPASAASFQPTQKELLSAARVVQTVESEDAPRRRGRKPSKKR